MKAPLYRVRTALLLLAAAVYLAETPTAPALADADADVLLETEQPVTLVLPNGETRQVQLVKLTTQEIKFKTQPTDTKIGSFTAKSGLIRKILTAKGETFVVNAATRTFEPLIYGSEILNTDKAGFTARVDQVKKDLAKILTGPPAAAEATPLDRERQAALLYLQAQRYLAHVPYENLKLDEQYNQAAQAGAQLLEKIGRVDHRPANPGWPEAEYKLACEGTRGNLLKGPIQLVQALSFGWMHDTNANNMAQVGHRRWCLHPAMLKTGFGHSGAYLVMVAYDQSQRNVPDYDIICYPTYGLMPIAYFRPKLPAGLTQEPAAWHVSLNPAHYKQPTKTVKLQVCEIDATSKKVGAALSLNFFNPEPMRIPGAPFAIVFRPTGIAPEHGKSYLVEIEGLLTTSGQPAIVRYVVVFAEV